LRSIGPSDQSNIPVPGPVNTAVETAVETTAISATAAANAASTAAAALNVVAGRKRAHYHLRTMVKLTWYSLGPR
jgi:hypothetical protein